MKKDYINFGDVFYGVLFIILILWLTGVGLKVLGWLAGLAL